MYVTMTASGKSCEQELQKHGRDFRRRISLQGLGADRSSRSKQVNAEDPGCYRQKFTERGEGRGESVGKMEVSEQELKRWEVWAAYEMWTVFVSSTLLVLYLIIFIHSQLELILPVYI